MNKQNGFTLIELMVVIAILGILLAIFIPAWQDYRNKGMNETRVEQPQRINIDEKPREYIDNSVRDNSTKVEIKTHSDGTKYACVVGEDKCYKVK